MKKILGVSKGNFWIYIVGLVISFLFIGLYFINPENAFLTVLMSVGASLVGAIVLAYFVDYFNCKNQDEKTAKIRYGKLDVIEVGAIALFERIAYWYFRKRFDIFSYNNADKCHKITFKEFWDEVEKLEDKCSQCFMSDGFSMLQKEKLSQINKSIIAKCNQFGTLIANQENNLTLFEAAGYFSNDEVLSLMAAKSYSEELGHFVDALETDSIKCIFEQLLEIPELQHIESMVVYYKDKSTAYETSKFKRRYRKNISEEDIANAIDSNSRIIDKQLKN